MQILKAIWEQVSLSFTISWLDVLEFRETHLSGAKHAVQALNYRFHQRQYQEQRCFSQGSEDFLGTNRYPTIGHQSAPVLATNHSFPPLSGHVHAPAPLCIYPHPHNNCYGGYLPQNYPHCTVPVPFPYPHPAVKQQFPPPTNNGYCYTNGYAPSTGYAYPVPTAQLIELEHTYDVPDSGRRPSSISVDQSVELNRNKSESDYRLNNNTDKDQEGSGTFESWDYVYRNLKSQGYSKDLGERGDILRNSTAKEANSKQHLTATDLEDALANLSVVDRPLKISEQKAKHKDKEAAVPKKQITPSSSYDNLSAKDTSSNSKKLVQTSSKTMPRDSKPDSSKTSKATSSKTIDHRKSAAKANDADTTTTTNKPNNKLKETRLKVNGNNNNNTNKWSCSTCTYLNSTADEICQMCFKSKRAVCQDMEVGGSECSNCTLVNPKNCQKCEACEHPLKDSPTYI